jgi:hypothetical protein
MAMVRVYCRRSSRQGQLTRALAQVKHGIITEEQMAEEIARALLAVS